jgi:hypothetical protein
MPHEISWGHEMPWATKALRGWVFRQVVSVSRRKFFWFWTLRHKLNSATVLVRRSL